MVPLLTKTVNMTDSLLAVLGSVSIIGEYTSYGLVSDVAYKFFMWLGPPMGILSNASIIAFRSMSTKLVADEEKGNLFCSISLREFSSPQIWSEQVFPLIVKVMLLSRL